MAAFRHLLGLNIPCVWQIVPSQDKELIVLELSVFWFDDKHTDIIDSNTHLKELKGKYTVYTFTKKKPLKIISLLKN